MERDLLTILIRDNPWLRGGDLGKWLGAHLPGNYIGRDLVDQAGESWRTAGKAHLVVGPRQAGKTTALWAHLRDAGKRVLYLDCEQELVRSWCRSAPLFLEELE